MVEDAINTGINDIFNVLFAGRCYSLDSKRYLIRKIRIHEYIFKRYCVVIQLQQRRFNYILFLVKYVSGNSNIDVIN